ncbi:MAG: hypothetical protein H6719_03135 [Sandaracinaceae bacterium]|nr:hypothetical protein [Sandaracinaceae bacterium]
MTASPISTRRRASRPLALLTLLLAGCANGGPGGGGTDAGGGGGSDAGATDGGGMTMIDAGGGGRDAGGMTGCGAGQHACGGGCIDDQENIPENGCRFGCGEPCPTPPDGAAACDAMGACTFDCPPPFRRVGDECTCAPRTCMDWGYTCGAPDDGCGMPLDCGSCTGGGTCIDGACSCPPDDREPNDSRLTAPRIGSATDAPDTNLVFDTFSLHEMGDEDWFIISVADDFDAGNPRVRVTLRGFPSGDDYDLAAYYICGSGGDSSTCSVGATDNMIGHGCTSTSTGATAETIEIATECSGTDDGGDLVIHITPRTVSGMCGAYEIEVDVS